MQKTNFNETKRTITTRICAHAVEIHDVPVYKHSEDMMFQSISIQKKNLNETKRTIMSVIYKKNRREDVSPVIYHMKSWSPSLPIEREEELILKHFASRLIESHLIRLHTKSICPNPTEVIVIAT